MDESVSVRRASAVVGTWAAAAMSAAARVVAIQNVMRLVVMLVSVRRCRGT